MSPQEILSLLFALLPAVWLRGWGRYLVRRLDDPAFPELYFKKVRWLGVVLGIGLVGSLLVSSRYAAAKLAILFLAAAVADFPARREILRETWGLKAYLAHGLRLYLAMIGPWALAILLPLAVIGSGDLAPAVAAAWTAAIVLWSLFNDRILPWILGARPFAPGGLEEGFAAVAAKARCPPPRLLRCGPEGGTFVNAFALPSLRRPGVLFTEGLLAALGPRETIAIFAHELGHLEHHGPRSFLRRQLVLGGVLAGVLSLLFVFGPTSSLAATVGWMWPVGCVLTAAWIQARNQAREHESDLRAVELCGDGRALADALLKIYLLTRMPRRWAAASERRMSHPSLAQRLRAIREAAGDEAGEGTRPAGPRLVVRAAGDPTRAVVLAEDRLHWLDGLPAGAELEAASAPGLARDARAIRYGDLADLRLDAGGFRRHRLRATDRRGRKLTLPLPAGDVAAVKAAIAQIDRRVLATARSASPEVAAAEGLPVLRLQAAAVVLVALLPPVTAPLALAALLALIRPARATLAATGAIGVASALLELGRSLRPGWDLGPESAFGTSALQGFLGLLFLAQAWRRRRRGYPDPGWTAWTAAGVFGAFALLSAAGAAVRLAHTYPLFQLHRWARDSPEAVLLLLGTAAAVATFRRPAARLPALALAAGAALVVGLGTPGFRERFGGDPLATLEPRLETVSRTLAKVRDAASEEVVATLVLSPSGERLAFGSYVWGDVEDDGYGDLRFAVERPGGGALTVSGTVLEFLDDDRVAVLATTAEGTVLSTVSLAPRAEDDFEVVLPHLEGPELELDGPEWEVTGIEAEGPGRWLVRLAGRFGSPEVRRESWDLPDEEEGPYLSWLGVSPRGRVLAVVDRAVQDALVGPTVLFLLGSYVESKEIATVEPSGLRILAATTLSVECLDPSPRGFVCLASDSQSTQLWSIDPESGQLEALGSLTGDYWQGRPVGDGRWVLGGFGDPLALVDPEAGRVARIGEQIHPPVDFGPTALAVRAGLLAVAVPDAAGGSRIDVYRLPPR